MGRGALGRVELCAEQLAAGGGPRRVIFAAPTPQAADAYRRAVRSVAGKPPPRRAVLEAARSVMVGGRAVQLPGRYKGRFG